MRPDARPNESSVVVLVVLRYFQPVPASPRSAFADTPTVIHGAPNSMVSASIAAAPAPRLPSLQWLPLPGGSFGDHVTEAGKRQVKGLHDSAFVREAAEQGPARCHGLGLVALALVAPLRLLQVIGIRTRSETYTSFRPPDCSSTQR